MASPLFSLPPFPLNEGMAKGAEQVRFAAPRQAKGVDIASPLDKVPLTQSG
jgi:hypothetical protein